MPLRNKANPETVIRLLNDALASEIVCILRYKRHYFMTAGMRTRHVKAKFLQYATDEQAHADKLAERIVQLKSEPEWSFERLLKGSQADGEGDSLVEMITADLFAEQNAIASYRAMIGSIGTADPTTRWVLEQILIQEEHHAADLARLLRETDWVIPKDRTN